MTLEARQNTKSSQNCAYSHLKEQKFSPNLFSPVKIILNRMQWRNPKSLDGHILNTEIN